MALTKRQMEEYSGMSFEEMCDLIDQYKSDEEELNDKISDLEDKIKDVQNAFDELENKTL